MGEKRCDIYKQVGLRIGYYRRLRRYTKEELAEKIDRSTTFISSIEAANVKQGISMDTFLDIAKALDVEPYKFFIKED